MVSSNKRIQMDNPKDIDSNKHSSDIYKGCVLEADLEYPKGLHEFHNNYFLAPDKTEIKKEINGCWYL